MKPILAIISALLVTVIPFLVLFDIGLLYHIRIMNLIFLFIIFMIIGGGISTWFSNENRIRYSVYYGLIILLLFGTIQLLNVVNSYYIYLLAPIFAGFAGIIAKNEKDNIKNGLNNISNINYKSFFVNLYKRNKLFLNASILIFLASLIVGSVGPFLSGSFHNFMMNLTLHYFSEIRGDNPTTFAIFLNNSTLAFLYLYIGGIGFGIFSTLQLIQIGLITSFISVQYPYSILFLLPHGIFELSAYVIATAAGFKLLSITISMIRDFIALQDDIPINDQVDEILDVNYLKFKDSLILIVIAIFILFIAAIIEANITVPLAHYILSLISH
ncbi:stage II sporulation protein M [Methanobacterium sp.]|uniref:stage II sporulation protein M n=1 Tax=Methanobacterium sp. TaxID=2164 RepID=UPI003C72BF67